MQEEALQRFLVSVRCQRFIDYLDPIGETADEALARRVRWARMTRNDPAHADEAMFLLQHELALRKVVATELEFDNGWVVGVDAGAEDGERGWSSNGENHTLIPEQAGDADATEEVDPSASPTGIMRMEDVSLDAFSAGDTQGPRTDAGSAASLDRAPPPQKGKRGKAAKPAEAAAPAANLTERPEPAQKPAGGPTSLLQPRGAVRTAGPALRRSSMPPMSTIGSADTVLPSTIATLPPEPDKSPVLRADDEQTDPSARMAPDLIRAIALAASGKDFDPVVVGSGGDPDAATVRPANTRDHTPLEGAPPLVRAPVRLGPKEDEGGPPWLVIAGILLVGAAVAGLFALSRTAPVELPEPIPSLPVQAPVTPTPEPPPVPVEPVPVEPVPVASVPVPIAPVPVVTPVPVAPVPVAPAPTPVAPTPVPAAPAPVVPTPVPVAPAPVPEPVVPKPAPAPIEPAPAPTPAPVSPAPVPVEVPEPVAVEPAPEPAGPPAAMKGLWGGVIGGRGFVLMIATQDGEAVAGTAEVLEPSGDSSKYQIAGTITGNQLRMTDGTGSVKFKATVDGKKANGTMERQGTSSSFSVSR